MSRLPAAAAQAEEQRLRPEQRRLRRPWLQRRRTRWVEQQQQ